MKMDSRLIHQIISIQAQKTPHAAAVWLPQETCTYQDLDQRSDRIAIQLRKSGVGTNTLVGICMEQSLETIEAILAVLKTGGTVAALGLEIPSARLLDLLKQYEICFVLTNTEFQIQELDLNVQVLDVRDLEKMNPDLNSLTEVDDQINVSPQDMALVLFTSGTTGHPKAVVYDHAGFVQRAALHCHEMPMESDDVYAVVSPVSSIDYWDEILIALLNGASAAVIPEEMVLQPDLLVQILEKSGTTRLLLVPSLLKGILKVKGDLKHAFRNIRLIAVGGEELSHDLKDLFYEQLPSIELVNFYGLTEGDAIFFNTSHPITGSPATVPIGRPLHNTWVDLLAEDGSLVEPGDVGEMYIASRGIARGYYKMPDLSASHFLPIPEGHACQKDLKRWGSVRYKTGDLARELPDGNLEYIGRRDRQVKIRGNTIHLNEIETAANRHLHIRESAAVMQKLSGISDYSRLALYLVADIRKVQVTEFRSFLSDWLPPFAIPSAIVFVDTIPRNMNGKVDEKALPEPELEHFNTERDFVPPSNEVEKRIVKIWEDLLHVHPIGTQDDFFDLGGDSMQIIVLLANLESEFNKNIPLNIFFQTATISKLAFFIQSEEEAQGSALVPIQTKGECAPFFCVHADGGVFLYQKLAQYLGEDQPVYGLQALDPASEEYLPSVRDMAAHYIQAIKTAQPEGPYNLGAFSLGGIILFEIAYQLAAMGEEIGLLAFLDASGPKYPRFSNTLNRMKYKITTHLATLKLLDWQGKLGYLGRRARSRLQREATSLLLGVAGWLKLPESPFIRHIRLRKTIHVAVDQYAPEWYPGKLVIFLAQEQPKGCVPDPDFGWGGLAQEIEIVEVQGSHNTIIKEPFIQDLAAVVKARIVTKKKKS